MRLIHCSDLHLDSKMESNLPADRARERKVEILDTFGRLVSWAGAHQVDGILIAGDLFDTLRVSAQTAQLVLDIMAAAGQIDFYYLRGNHDACRDPFAGWELPDNVHTFGADWTYYTVGDAVIAGIEPEDWSAMYDSLALSADHINIVMLHGQVSARPEAEQIALPMLREKHIDYLALGHLHSFRREPLDDRGCWCYSGCLEGRGFDECGEKGFVLLETGCGRVEATFVPFAARQLQEVTVDITGCDTITRLQNAMEAACTGVHSRNLVKFILTGTYTPQTQKDPAYLSRYFSQRFYYVKIKDESRFHIDKESYEHDISLKGEFIRLVMASDKSDEEKGRIICAGLQALAGEEVVV